MTHQSGVLSEEIPANSGTHLHRIGGVADIIGGNRRYHSTCHSRCSAGHNNGGNRQEEIECSPPFTPCILHMILKPYAEYVWSIDEKPYNQNPGVFRVCVDLHQEQVFLPTNQTAK